MQPSCSPTEAATCADLPPPCCLQPPRRRCSADASPAPAKTDVIHIIRARRVVLIRGGLQGGGEGEVQTKTFETFWLKAFRLSPFWNWRHIL